MLLCFNRNERSSGALTVVSRRLDTELFRNKKTGRRDALEKKKIHFRLTDASSPRDSKATTIRSAVYDRDDWLWCSAMM